MAETYRSAYTGTQIDSAVSKSLAVIDDVTTPISQIKTDISNKADKTQISNRNLLDNAWFTIDQRQGYISLQGVTVYNDIACTVVGGTQTESACKCIPSGSVYERRNSLDQFAGYVKASDVVRGYVGSCYAVDRWSIYEGTIKIDANGVKWVGNTLQQKVESDLLNSLIGKTVTLSVMYGDGAITSTTFTVASNSYQPINLTNGYFVFDNPNNRVLFSGVTLETIIRAVKLEVGSISTLHLDAPPNYAEELLKCQRYFYRLPTLNNTLYSAEQFIANGSYLIGCIVFPATMRKSPTITGLESVRRTSTGEIVPISIDYRYHSKSALGLFYGVGGLVEGEPYSLYATPNIDFSADL